MNLSTLRSTLRPGVMAALVLLSAGSVTASSVQYLVTLNTSSQDSTPGFLDFQLFPGDPSSQNLMAQITNFNVGGGALVNPNSPQLSGDAGGTLSATMTLDNGTARNEFFQPLNYGAFVSFVLSLAGPALDSPNGTATSGSQFGVGLYDGGQNPILTSDMVNGFAGQVSVNLDGSTTPQSFPTATNGPSVITFQELPEPGTIFLLGLGSLGLTVLRLRRKRR